MIIYTKHAEDKLKRADIKKFKIKKNTLQEVLTKPRSLTKTKYNDFAAVAALDQVHDLRVIHVIIDVGVKIITFHIARKGRYI